MLSQRIALFSREIYHAETEADAALLAKKMRKVTNRMVENHAILTTGDLDDDTTYDLDPQIVDIYFGERNMDVRVRSYTDLAQKFLNTYETAGQDAVRNTDTMERIVSIARNGLLADLDEIVSAYQAWAEMRVERFERLELVIICIAFLLLLLEVLLIFRPMVRSVVRSISELELANAELMEFSYRISHDLRAPIVSSLGLVRTSKNMLGDGKVDVVAKSLDHIEKSMIKLEGLIEDILNLTKMKLSEIQHEAVHVNQMLQDCIEKLDNIEHFEDIDFEMDIDVADTIITKKTVLEQVFSNLLSNAIKYSDPEKEQSFIKVKAATENGYHVFRIEDNGLGIPEEFHGQVFGMFKRFHPRRSFGSGLGLYLVRQNVAGLGGDIRYIPLQDGTAFEFSFPEN